MIGRIFLSMFVAAVLFFTVFGFYATFEPLPASQQWTWRVIHGSIAVVCLGSLWRLWFRGNRGG